AACPHRLRDVEPPRAAARVPEPHPARLRDIRELDRGRRARCAVRSLRCSRISASGNGKRKAKGKGQKAKGKREVSLRDEFRKARRAPSFCPLPFAFCLLPY